MENNSTKLYLALDQIKEGKLINNYSEHTRVSLLSNTENETPAGNCKIDFDRYKGSFLTLESAAKLNIEVVNHDLFSRPFAVNFNFNYDKKDNSGEIVILSVNSSLVLKAGKVENEIEGGKTSERNALILYYKTVKILEISNHGDAINIREGKWYNITLEFRRDDNYFIALHLTDDKKTVVKEWTGFLGENFVPDKIEFGGNNDEDLLRLSDVYLIENITTERIAQLYKKSFNPVQKKDWVHNITFDIKSIVNDDLLQGIYKQDNATQLQFSIKKEQDDFSYEGDVQLKLCIKKGFLSFEKEHKLEGFTIEDEVDSDSIAIVFSLKSGNNQVLLPPAIVENLTGQTEVLVNCALQNGLIKVGNGKVNLLETPISIDNTFGLFDYSGNPNVPFDVFVLGTGELIYGMETTQELKLRLINKTEKSVVLPKPDQLGKYCSFTIFSPYTKEIISEDVLQSINIKLRQKGGQEYSTVKNNDKSLSVYVSEDITIDSLNYIDINIAGIKLYPDKYSPVEQYIFYLEYKNIPGYNNNKIPFNFKTVNPPKPEIPIGTVVAYASDKIPDGWLLCDGAGFDSTKFPELFFLLNQANKTPDLKGRFLLGKSYSKPLFTYDGVETVTLNESQIPAHRHTINNGRFVRHGRSFTGEGDNGERVFHDGKENYNEDERNRLETDYQWKFLHGTDPRGGGDPHNNMPPYCVLNYIIKAK